MKIKSFLVILTSLFATFSIFSSLNVQAKVVAVPKKKPTPSPTATLTPTRTPTATPTPVIGNADISVNVVAETIGLTNTEIKYTITINNNGPDTATSVQFCSQLDPSFFSMIDIDTGLFGVAVGAGGGRYPTCSVYGELSTLLPGASESMYITIVDIGPMTRINTINTSSLEIDSNPGNNSQVLTTVVGQ